MLSKKIKWMVLLFLCLTGCIYCDMDVTAQEADYQESVIEAEGFGAAKKLSDANSDTYTETQEKGTVTVSRTDGIGAIYIKFDRVPQEWELRNPVSDIRVSCGENAYLHEFVNVAELFGETPETLVMTFEEGTVIADIFVFSEGKLPDWVQIWEPPCEEADLLLVSSHSDDEQLFFAGILPYYAGERGFKVQVAYVIQHFEVNGVRNHQRPHEQLDGLWTVGVRNYPVMSEFPDLYAESKERKTAFEQASAVFESVGITYDDFIGYITECIRRFKPYVVVSHDLDGEYGHGTHVLCSAALTEAITCATDAECYPESANLYGTWEVQKTYLHLYGKNPIVMDFDVPLEHFEGKTAFEVSQEGFACHKSQHWTWFYKWMYGTEESPIKKASAIRKYSPCQYGLYDTKVGFDRIGGDFFENVKSYTQQEQEAEREKEFVRDQVKLYFTMRRNYSDWKLILR